MIFSIFSSIFEHASIALSIALKKIIHRLVFVIPCVGTNPLKSIRAPIISAFLHFSLSRESIMTFPVFIPLFFIPLDFLFNMVIDIQSFCLSVFGNDRSVNLLLSVFVFCIFLHSCRNIVYYFLWHACLVENQY